MFGFITKRAHDAKVAELAEEHAAEIKTLTDARDHLVRCLNDAELVNREQANKLWDALEEVDKRNRLIIPLESDLHAKNNRITNMQKDIDRLEAEVERMRPIVEKAERRRALAMKNLQQNKGKTPA